VIRRFSSAQVSGLRGGAGEGSLSSVLSQAKLGGEQVRGAASKHQPGGGDVVMSHASPCAPGSAAMASTLGAWRCKTVASGQVASFSQARRAAWLD
jgi:hypothetical protein